MVYFHLKEGKMTKNEQGNGLTKAQKKAVDKKAHLDFLREEPEGFCQITDPTEAVMMFTRLLVEKRPTMKRVMKAILSSPHDETLFQHAAAFYQFDEVRWSLFVKAAGEVEVREYLERSMGDIVFPILERGLGLIEDDELN